MTRPVWVTGARGMLGRELVARLRAAGDEVIATGSEVDVADRGQLVAALAGRRPRTIYNAAAYTAVDAAENDRERAFAANAEGAGNVAVLARELDADLVHVSTDYVLAGAIGEPLREDAPTAPLGVYARSKRAGEVAVLATVPRAGDARRVIVLRSSWLFADHPRSFVTRILSLLAEREELHVVADQHGRPTAASDLASVAIALGRGELPGASGVLHFASPGVTTWHGFAGAIHEVASRHGLPVKTRVIHAVSTADHPRPAPRPGWSVLDCALLEGLLAARGMSPRPWRDALEALIGDLARARR